MNIKKKIMCAAALLLLYAMSVVAQIENVKIDKDAVRRAVSGRFRVTLTGFTVNRQSSDNILESDGTRRLLNFLENRATPIARVRAGERLMKTIVGTKWPACLRRT